MSQSQLEETYKNRSQSENTINVCKEYGFEQVRAQDRAYAKVHCSCRCVFDLLSRSRITNTIVILAASTETMRAIVSPTETIMVEHINTMLCHLGAKRLKLSETVNVQYGDSNDVRIKHREPQKDVRTASCS